MFKSQMLKESIQISSILIKEKNIELQIERRDHKLPNKRKEETKELQSKGKENIML